MDVNKLNIREHQYNIDFKKRAVELYISGLSYNKVRKIVGCSVSSVIRWCRLVDVDRISNVGVKRGTNKTYDDEFINMFKDDIISLYKSGMTTRQVSRELGLHGRLVYNVLRKDGLNRSVSEALKVAGVVPPSQKGIKRSKETRDKLSKIMKGNIHNPMLAFQGRNIDFMNVKFRSKVEVHFCEWLIKIGKIEMPIDGVNCNIAILNKQFDFFVHDIFIELHPWEHPFGKRMNYEEYYKKRRDFLNRYGCNDKKLVLVTDYHKNGWWDENEIFGD